MKGTRPLQRTLQLLQERFIWAMLASYLMAAYFPALGLKIRAMTFGELSIRGSTLSLSLPACLLAVLLFNASLGVRTEEIRKLLSSTHVLLFGVIANTAVPLLFTLGSALGLVFWHSYEEVQALLVGLAIVGAMPIAGSSTAWSQNADGNMSMSLGLVFVSTLLSPFLTPLVFHLISKVTMGDYSEDLVELAGAGTQLFLLAAVVMPAMVGLVVGALLGPKRRQRIAPAIKATNLVVILLLNYANAASALPQVAKNPDIDFLLLVFGTAAALCALAFASGHWVGRWAGAAPSERVSLMFALGMNNNGSGLVLASLGLADHPNVLLTIVAYNLVQQIVASLVDHFAFRRTDETRVSPPSLR